MTPPRNRPDGDTPAAEVEEQMQSEAEAAEKREAQAEKATHLKSQPEGALPPLEKQSSDGTVSYAHSYLIEHALELTGHPMHVMSGALYGTTQEYLSAAEATKLADTWLETEVTTTPEQG